MFPEVIGASGIAEALRPSALVSYICHGAGTIQRTERAITPGSCEWESRDFPENLAQAAGGTFAISRSTPADLAQAGRLPGRRRASEPAGSAGPGSLAAAERREWPRSW